MFLLTLHLQQKGSWGTIIGILQSKAEPEATLFAAITLRGKVMNKQSNELQQCANCADHI